ncbi:MAG: hypothetical protein EA383_08780 [Spirochaetaceae bacterium]|nr:MAG: hypothetical protein EA383_08780 [Spirochaetaceae bacterium]
MSASTQRLIVQTAHAYNRITARAFGLKLADSHEGLQQYTAGDQIMIVPDPDELMIRTAFTMGALYRTDDVVRTCHRQAVLVVEVPDTETIAIVNAVNRDGHRSPYYPDVLLAHSLPERQVNNRLAETFVQTVQAYVPPHGVSILAVPPCTGSKQSTAYTRFRREATNAFALYRNYLDRLSATCSPEVSLTPDEYTAVMTVCRAARLHRNDERSVQKAALARRIRTGSVPVNSLMEIRTATRSPTSGDPRSVVATILRVLEADLATY